MLGSRLRIILPISLAENVIADKNLWMGWLVRVGSLLWLVIREPYLEKKVYFKAIFMKVEAEKFEAKVKSLS